MSDHKATIHWQQPSADFLRGKYSREHTWSFDGGITVAASSSPSVVPVPYSNPANVDPEEAFIAAISSCHLLSFLYVAFRGGFVVESYDDEAVGSMTKNEQGILWVSTVILHPRISFGGEKLPTKEETDHLHHLAHEQCFIANSVKTDIRVAS
jgi:organic hydroperoxide reductase OsmC/OhrA